MIGLFLDHRADKLDDFDRYGRRYLNGRHLAVYVDNSLDAREAVRLFDFDVLSCSVEDDFEFFFEYLKSVPSEKFPNIVNMHGWLQRGDLVNQLRQVAYMKNRPFSTHFLFHEGFYTMLKEAGYGR